MRRSTLTLAAVLAALPLGIALVAADLSPSNEPVTASLAPVKTAVTDPEPATVACIDRSIGTGDRRALYVFVCWAVSESAPASRSIVNKHHFAYRIAAAPGVGRGNHMRAALLDDQDSGAARCASSVCGECTSYEPSLQSGKYSATALETSLP